MADIYSVLTDITNGLNATLAECGFTPVIPAGVVNAHYRVCK